MSRFARLTVVFLFLIGLSFKPFQAHAFLGLFDEEGTGPLPAKAWLKAPDGWDVAYCDNPESNPNFDHPSDYKKYKGPQICDHGSWEGDDIERQDCSKWETGLVIKTYPEVGSNFICTDTAKEGFDSKKVEKTASSKTADNSTSVSMDKRRAKEYPKSLASVDLSCLDAKQEGYFLICNEDTTIDIRTNLMWMRHTYMIWTRNGDNKKKVKLLSLREASAWADKMNGKRLYGHSNWRLPVTTEMSAIHNKNRTDCKHNYPGANSLRYPTSFHCEIVSGSQNDGGYEWVGDTKKDGRTLGWAFSLSSGSNFIPNKGRGYNFRLVRNGPLDLMQILKSTEQTGRRLNSAEADKARKALAAFKAGLKNPGVKFFKKIITSNPLALFEGNYAHKIYENKGSLVAASELLLAVKDKKGTSPAFWFDYGHNANLAGQPKLALKAASKLARINKGKMTQDAAALTRAVAYSQLGKMDDAYHALLDRNPLGPVGAYYLNQYGQQLLSDKKKLSTITGIDELLFVGEQFKVKPQAFHDIETGKLIDSNASVASMSQPISSKPKKPRLGVVIQAVTKELASFIGLSSTEGALVQKVKPGSPAELGGIQKGDVIKKFGAKAIKNFQDLPSLVKQAQTGQKIPVQIIRAGKTQKITITIGGVEKKTKTVKPKSAPPKATILD